MTSQLLEHASGVFLNPFPDPKPLADLLGAVPVEPGYYGQAWGDTILLTTNHRPTLAKIGQMPALSLTVLALDAGGFTPEAAAALDAVSSVQVDRVLSDITDQIPTQKSLILVPYFFAANFKWKNGTQAGSSCTVRVVPGDLTKLQIYLQSEAAPDAYTEKHLPAVLWRMMTGLKLLISQAAILAIPMLIFGWQALVKGLAALLFSTIVLAFFWRILPGREWQKGLVAGTILALSLALILIFAIKTSVFLYPSLGLFLSCFWMSIIFSGVKH
jgi:hypothetical protein